MSAPMNVRQFRANDRQPPSFVEALFLRGIDFALAAVGILVLVVPILLIALLIRLTSRGPALFAQERIGLGQHPFTMYKFRTMRSGTDDAAPGDTALGDAALRELVARELRGEDTSVDGGCKLAHDPRITRVGGWLRATSLDELPQLINVLRGEMSLVGPRPCLPWEAGMFPAESAERFTVRPGITGLWQVNGRSTLGTLDMLRLDVAYARQRCLRMYLSILWRTGAALLRGDGAR